MNPENIFDENLMRSLNYDRQCFVWYCHKNGHPPPGLPAMNHTDNPYEHLRAQPQQPLNDSNNPTVPQKEQERQNNGNAGIPQQQQGGQIMVQAPHFTFLYRAASERIVSDILQRYVTGKINPTRYSTAAPAASSSVSTTAALILAKKSASSTATPTPPPNTPSRNGTAQALIQSSSASKPQTAQPSFSIPNRVSSPQRSRHNSAPYYAIPVRGSILISRKKPAARK